MKAHPPTCIFLAAASLVIAFAGCASPQYQRAYKDVIKPGGSYTGIEGPWTGHWLSNENQHHGKLRCIVTKSDSAATAYDFHYWASFFTIFSADYHVTYDVTEKNGRYFVTGEQDLGKFGGIYTHTGEATPTKFTSTYKAEKDHGTFELERP